MLAALLFLGRPDIPKITLPDLRGKSVEILPSNAKKGVVVFFVLSGCPNANTYVPEMNLIAKQYGPKGWKFYLIYTDTSTSVRDLIKSAKDFNYFFPALHGQGRLMALAHAAKSPDAAVFSSGGDLLYNGRIDDRFYALGKSRFAPKVRDLRLALDAIDHGKPVLHPTTDVIGCYIPTK